LQYNIGEIFQDQDEDDVPSKIEYVMLCRDGIVFNKDLQKILQVVVDYLYKFAG
jgi:hypothetical protein